MNFFEYQDKARRNSAILIALFAAAVLGLIAITTLFLTVATQFSQSPGTSTESIISGLGWESIAGIAITITAIIGLASLYRLRQLAAGGRAVAESLGGRKINIAPKGLLEQRALNVVEEMALASGTPVPDVYLIEDDAINAFAAGYKSSDAVIGLTRGCIEQLNREQLQGVVAHEFSHIFNGDMRLNLRIVGLLHGILIIGLLGSWLLRGSLVGRRSHMRHGRNNSGRGALFGLGAGLVVIGYTGTFFGNLIKSAVSRQREYLADASAVQFTRSNVGIAGALKKIGGHSHGSRLSAANASEFSHMYFSSSLKNSLLGFFATHPPLEARIGRLDPHWNGGTSHYSPQSQNAHDASSAAAGEQISVIHRGEVAPASLPTVESGKKQGQASQGEHYRAQLDRVLDAVDNDIARPSGTHIELGRALLAQVPADLKSAARDPFSARAVIYGLLINTEQKTKQLEILKKFAHPAVLREFNTLRPSLEALPVICRLALLDLCIPALKALVPQQYQVFKRNLIKLVRADDKLEVWEWALYQVLMHGLETSRDLRRRALTVSNRKGTLGDAQRFLLAAMAHAGNSDYLSAKRAFEAGLAVLGESPVPLPTASDITLQRLDKALAIAQHTAPLKQPILLKALATTLAHDGLVNAVEAELLRAIADCLDCPMPPIPPGTDLPPKVSTAETLETSG